MAQLDQNLCQKKEGNIEREEVPSNVLQPYPPQYIHLKNHVATNTPLQSPIFITSLSQKNCMFSPDLHGLFGPFLGQSFTEKTGKRDSFSSPFPILYYFLHTYLPSSPYLYLYLYLIPFSLYILLHLFVSLLFKFITSWVLGSLSFL
jgi:hypothetical protein